MPTSDTTESIHRPMLFADSAVVIAPTDDQLVDIGLGSIETWNSLISPHT